MIVDGGALRAHRVRLGLTQAGLAELLGVTPTTIARWERGEKRIGNPERVTLALQDALAISRPRTNLPADVSRFIGREHETGALVEALRSSRLVSVVGAGGIGKTRLALHVGERLLPDYEDGVWLVELASLTESSLVPQVVASSLGIGEQHGREMVETLIDAFGGRRLLVLLDNCEHLIDSCAQLAGQLLRACRRLSILATSREALRMDGERVWPIPALSLPYPSLISNWAEVSNSEAVRLLVDRAQAIRPDIVLDDATASTFAAICRRLDGVPLAIELGAARLRVLTLEELAGRLDDQLAVLVGGNRTSPARHHTLRSALEWSYALLSPSEQRVFERLSVFSGGCNLSAAEEVCEDETIDKSSVIDILGHLVEKSLVSAVESRGALRFRMLEPVRQFARQQLVERGELDLWRNRHSQYFLIMTERTEPESWGPGEAEWRARLEAEVDNFRVALRWLIDSGQVQLAQRMGGSFARFWKTGSFMRECLAWMTELLQIPGGDAWTLPRARVLVASGEMSAHLGWLDRSEQLLEEGLTVCRTLSEPDELATALWQTAHTLWWNSKFDRARAFAEEGVAVSHAAGLTAQEGHCLYVLAGVADWINEPTRACDLARQSLEMHQAIGYVRGIAIARQTLARALYHLGDVAGARTLLEQSTEQYRESAYPYGVAWNLITLGWIATDQRDFARARDSLTVSLRTFRELGADARIAEALEGFAQLACAEGNWRRALRLGGAAHLQRQRTGMPLMPVGIRQLEPRLQRARLALSQAKADAAWEEGTNMTVDDAIAEALAREPHTPGVKRSSLLTTRERQVAELVGQGLTNRQIAEQLVIAERTAQAHIERIFTKLDMHSRVQLATWISAD